MFINHNMKYFFKLLLLVNFLFFKESDLFATKLDDSQIYTVNDLKIQAKSTNPTKAKDEALKNGLRNALKIVFKNLEIDESYTKFLTDSTISDIVSSVRIYDEIITKDSYASYIVVMFDKNFLEYNLNNLGIKPKKIVFETYLYIPLFDNGKDEIELLDNSNIWYTTAYNKFFEQKSDRIFIIDNYSLSNSGLLSWDKINNKDYESFSTLLKKYNSNTVMISIAKYNEKYDKVEINLIEINAENKINRVLNYVNKDNYNFEQLIAKASEKTFNFIINLTTKQEINTKNNETKEKSYIDVLVPIKKLDSFIYIKNLLKNLNFIKDIQTVEITTKFARLKIQHTCDETELIDMFRRKNFVLDISDDQYLLNYIGD